MSDITTAISQFIPILIGIGILFGMKSINLAKSKIRIETPEIQQLLTEDITETKQYTLLENADSTIINYLIVNGKLPKIKDANLAAYAIENAGIATYKTLQNIILPNYKTPNKMVLILKDSSLLTRILAKTDPISGILLAYNLNEALEIVNKWT